MADTHQLSSKDSPEKLTEVHAMQMNGLHPHGLVLVSNFLESCGGLSLGAQQRGEPVARDGVPSFLANSLLPLAIDSM